MEWPAVLAVLLVLVSGVSAGAVGVDAEFGAAPAFELDPLGHDSDGDGLLDRHERMLDTDPTRMDSDDDGLADPVELDGPTDPLVADTDGDGLTDGEEAELGSDPLVADTDGDGLSDSRETDIGTDPLVADTDADGLEDGREIDLGTDPLAADTDGDRLLDGWEVAGESADGAPLPDADPLRMDLYVELLRPEGGDRFTEREQATLERYWAEMPVANPDGSTGISIHVRRQTVASDVVHVDGDDGRDARDYYDARYLGNRTGEYHLAVLTTEYEFGGSAAFGTAPGPVSVYAPWPGFRADVLTHELLHNVLGRVDSDLVLDHDPYHTSEGFLTPTGAEPYLPESVAEQLEDEGFAG